MKLTRLRVWGAAAAVAAGVLAGAPPAAAAPHPIQLTGLTIEKDHVDVTAGPATQTITVTLTHANFDENSRDLMGWVTLRQFAGGTAIGAPWELRFFQPIPDPGSGMVTIPLTFELPVPRYGTAPGAVWRVTEIYALDGRFDRTLHRRDLARFDPEFGVTQLVETDAPVLDGIGLGPDQSPAVIDSGAGTTVDYRVTVTDLPSGFWKGRLVVAGPEGTRITTPFAVAYNDGRHTTCGVGSLIDDIYDDVECAVDVRLPAGEHGVWSVARVALTDRLGNTVTLASPAGPQIVVSAA